MLKLQVQAISMVIIAGIVLSLAGAAYFWGKPMIEKRSTMTDIATAKSFILQLDRHITDVAKGGGAKSITIPQISGSSMLVNVTGNEIVFRFFTSEAMIYTGEDSMPVPVETYDEDPVGQYGGSPRIITLEGETEDDRHQMTLRLKYRELDVNTPPKKGYKIVIVDGGKTGRSVVGVSYIGVETAPGEASNGGDLIKTRINVTLS
jgi:hypothetical protein